MGKLYANPLRVYLLLGALALIGIFSGIRLPVSLFPNSSKPKINVRIPYGNMTAEEFLHTYGEYLENQIHSLSTETLEVEKTEATYDAHRANIVVEFKWGVSPTAALKEIETRVNAFAARLPEETRDSIGTWLWNDNAGFLALSFYSDTRSLDDLYDLLEPILTPKLSKVRDAQDPELWNPARREIRITMKPDAVAALQLLPRDIETAVVASLGGRTGGSVTIGPNRLHIEMPRQIQKVPDLGKIPIPTPTGKSVHLGEIASIEQGPKTMDSRSFKTNGAPSLILFASPKPGGNVKRMAEETLAIVKEIMPSLPKDVQYRELVDPSEFIRSAVNNVFHEVGIAALLAVLVLFLFIGSVRNVITAAIEIPLSMVLAFILMRLTGMNLNLISLGGLALSAGMNVDASVVVMENIFRHFETHPGPHDFATRLNILVTAVKEVQFAVIASTISSLVVFLPLTFTSDLSYAILGDLALAVVFSHGFSAFVALLLVPTVRLHLMGSGTEKPHHSPIERQLKWLEDTYGRLLGAFISRTKLKWSVYGGLAVLLGLLVAFVLPHLPREVLGKPDTDWITLNVSTSGNTLLKQMEQQSEEVERQLLTEFGPHIQYTFNQVYSPNNANLMARLKDKSEMRDIWKKLEKRFTDTPVLFFEVEPWNPSELPIPDPPDLRIAIRGGELKERQLVTKNVLDLFQEKKLFPHIHSEPTSDIERGIFLEPHIDQWTALQNGGGRVVPSDLADMIRIATSGRMIGRFPTKNHLTEVILRYPPESVESVEGIGAFPVGVGAKLIPLKALASVRVQEASPPILREDGRELFVIKGRHDTDEEPATKKKASADATKLVAQYEREHPAPANGKARPTLTVEDAAKDLTEAIAQLGGAVGLSILLIFLTLLLQFGSFAEPLLVLVSIPLGFIGVLVSLFVFRSTLSLNSILGVILLNGIAVANSIILVDFIKRRVEAGLPPIEAAIDAARKRLRPILITSLTTVLGMLPIAIGAGEGGRILQPLGIAVTGGLWVSMGLTLFLVPALQVSYLQWRAGEHRISLRRPRFRLWRPAFSLLFLSLTAHGADLSFEDAMKQILDRSIDIGVQKENYEVTRAHNLPSRLSLLPSISVSATQPINYANNPNLHPGVQASADLNLFRFGADVAAMKAASAENQQQLTLIDDQKIKVEDEAVRALLNYIQNRKEVGILQNILQIRADLVGVFRERYAKGLSASQEVDKLSVDRGNDESRLRDAEIAALSSEETLDSLLGHHNVTLEYPWITRLDKASTRIARGEPPDLSLRPDWKAATERVDGSRQRASQTWGKMLPTLDLNLAVGYYRADPTSGSLFGGSLSGPEWSGAAVLTIPLFDRLVNYGNYQAELHSKSIAELELEKVRRVATAEYRAARDSLLIALETAKRRDETLDVSRRLYGDNLRRFKRGLVDANDLSVDQERSYNAELFAIRGWSALHQSFTHLCHAMGMPVARCLETI